MEFICRPSWKTIGEHAQIFSHFTYDMYGSPNNLNFKTHETWFSHTDVNFTAIANNLVERIYMQSEAYKTNETHNLVILLGGDFAFQNADLDF